MRVGSLFAGIGGFDLAAERAGMEIAWQAENDPAAAELLGERFPGVENLGDVHDVRFRRAGIVGGAARVDVLAGGFPCQDYSLAGSRGGLAGDRGALWWEFHRLADEGRPDWIVGENVPGLLSSRGGRDFGTIIDSLTELGYRVGWRVLDAQHFGVAQRRRRLFIVGHSGERSVSEVCALPEGLSGHPRPSREEGPAAPGEAEGSAGGDSAAIAEGDLARALGAVGGGNDYGANKGTLVVGFSSNMSEPDAISELSPPIKVGTGGDRPAMPPAVAFAANQRDEVRELGDRSVALASVNGMKGRTFLASPQVRRLTPLECERLQGFPDGWTENGQSDAQRYRQLGNAVAVPVAEWLLRRIVEG